MDHGSPSSDVPTENSEDGQLREYTPIEITEPNYPLFVRARGRSPERLPATGQAEQQQSQAEVDRTAQSAIGVCTLRDSTNVSSSGESSRSAQNQERHSAPSAEYMLLTLVMRHNKHREHLVQVKPSSNFLLLAEMARRQWADVITAAARLELTNQRSGRVSASSKL